MNRFGRSQNPHYGLEVSERSEQTDQPEEWPCRKPDTSRYLRATLSSVRKSTAAPCIIWLSNTLELSSVRGSGAPLPGSQG